MAILGSVVAGGSTSASTSRCIAAAAAAAAAFASFSFASARSQVAREHYATAQTEATMGFGMLGMHSNRHLCISRCIPRMS